MLLALMDPERQPYKVDKSAVTTTQLAAEGGATLVIAALRRALGARPIQEAVRLFRQLMGLRDMRRQPGERMRKWTARFEAFIKKTGKALHQADAEIDEKTFLHPLIQESCCWSAAVCHLLKMRPSWPRVEQRRRMEAPLETAICMLIWPQASSPSGTMRHSCVVTRLHRDVRITLPQQQQRRGICLLEQDTMDGGEPEEAEILDNDWTGELPPEDPELEDQFGSLEAAEAYAVTEFKNASSDMRNATRTFMEAKDLVSRVKHARGYFPVVGVGAFDVFQTTTPRGSRQTWSWTRKRETPSRFPTSIASQIQSDIGRSCEGRTGTLELEYNQVSVCSVAKWDICPGIVQIAGQVTTLESISSVLLVALWG